jgi:hypothetical protein
LADKPAVSTSEAAAASAAAQVEAAAASEAAQAEAAAASEAAQAEAAAASEAAQAEAELRGKPMTASRQSTEEHQMITKRTTCDKINDSNNLIIMKFCVCLVCNGKKNWPETLIHFSW